MNLGVRLNYINLIFEVYRAVTFDLKLLGVGLADEALAAHVDELGEELVLGRVDHGKGMDRNQDLVSLAVDPHGVIVVLVFVDSRCELNINVLGDARGNHAFLLVANFEERGLRGQNMESLGRRRVVDQPQLHRMRLVRLEACEFDHAWGRAEDPVRAHRVVNELLRDAYTLVRLDLRNYAPLNFNLILTVRRLANQALFKLLRLVQVVPLRCRLVCL
mmetsp:Transcript_1832/g.2648  ORF Transcript_1832/g.2648 Transcript_1832/m.2648 type:complete len:218 (-) Transcript_1832:151-804(-)